MEKQKKSGTGFFDSIRMSWETMIFMARLRLKELTFRSVLSMLIFSVTITVLSLATFGPASYLTATLIGLGLFVAGVVSIITR